MAETATGKASSGYLFGLLAYTWWGLVPLYFHQIKHVPAAEILAHRICWSIVILSVVTTFLANWKSVKETLRSFKLIRTLALSASLLALNWLLYIYATVTGRVAEASLGYFMMPLVNAFLGTMFLKEQLRPAHYPALTLVGLGVAIPAIYAGSFPVLAVALTVSFGLYGLVRKLAPVDSSTGLMVESLVMLPLSLGYLLFLGVTGTGNFGGDLALNGWLAFSGIVTVVPLLAFAMSIRRLPLLAVSFIQFLSPTVQLLLAVFYLHEPRTWTDWAAMGCVWIAVMIFIADAIAHNLGFRRHTAAVPACCLKTAAVPRLAKA